MALYCDNYQNALPVSSTYQHYIFLFILLTLPKYTYMYYKHVLQSPKPITAIPRCWQSICITIECWQSILVVVVTYITSSCKPCIVSINSTLLLKSCCCVWWGIQWKLRSMYFSFWSFSNNCCLGVAIRQAWFSLVVRILKIGNFTTNVIIVEGTSQTVANLIAIIYIYIWKMHPRRSTTIGNSYDELERVWTKKYTSLGQSGIAFWSLCLSSSLDFHWNSAGIKLSREWSAIFPTSVNIDVVKMTENQG